MSGGEAAAEESPTGIERHYCCGSAAALLMAFKSPRSRSNANLPLTDTRPLQLLLLWLFCRSLLAAATYLTIFAQRRHLTIDDVAGRKNNLWCLARTGGPHMKVCSFLSQLSSKLFCAAPDDYNREIRDASRKTKKPQLRRLLITHRGRVPFCLVSHRSMDRSVAGSANGIGVF